jgi:two-component system nitrogen regulation response regulator GlnG
MNAARSPARRASRQGRFEQANGGTLFLDEIGDMPAELQTRLLRVLAEGEFYRVGGHTPTRVDVRVIAATHQNSGAAGPRWPLFREDLYHRLNVIRIQLPSLNKRREDIPLLTRHFLGQAGRELGVESKMLRPETERLSESAGLAGQCPAIGKSVPLADGHGVRPGNPSGGFAGGVCGSAGRWRSRRPRLGNGIAVVGQPELARGGQNLLETALPSFERVMIRVALEQTGGTSPGCGPVAGLGTQHPDAQDQGIGDGVSEPVVG